jgi:hypothetical protein
VCGGSVAVRYSVCAALRWSFPLNPLLILTAVLHLWCALRWSFLLTDPASCVLLLVCSQMVLPLLYGNNVYFWNHVLAQGTTLIRSCMLDRWCLFGRRCRSSLWPSSRVVWLCSVH